MTLPGVMLTGRQGLELSAVLAAGGLALRFRDSGRRGRLLVPLALEASLISLLYGIWQLAHGVAITHVAGGTRHGEQVWDLERTLHLPSERTVQGWFLPHPGIVKLANLYYEGVHFPATIAMLAWLFLRHRERYRPVRTTLGLSTAMSLLLQLIPVAPPRLIPHFGMVDTALRYGQSVYGADGGGIADQLGAMPSVHVLWCVLVGVTVVRVSPSRWRWLAAVHTVVTILVVVLTANHYWMDGIVAVGLLGIAVLVQSGARLVVSRRRPIATAPARVQPDAALETGRDVLEPA